MEGRGFLAFVNNGGRTSHLFCWSFSFPVRWRTFIVAPPSGELLFRTMVLGYGQTLNDGKCAGACEYIWTYDFSVRWRILFLFLSTNNALRGAKLSYCSQYGMSLSGMLRPHHHNASIMISLTSYSAGGFRSSSFFLTADG